jgi:hypothetical protein
MATGGVFKAVYDSANRPITADGLVKTGPVVFMNINARKRSCGIDAKKRAEHGALTAGEWHASRLRSSVICLGRYLTRRD